MNTHWAVILPAVFSTFPVFLIYRGFCTIPSGLLEAGRIDGAGEWRLFWQIGLPLASGGILSAMVLGFLEYWNMIEQPLAFLKDKSLWPLSLYLPEISQNRAGFAFAASVVTLVPSVFVFLLGQDYLEQGIVSAEIFRSSPGNFPILLSGGCGGFVVRIQKWGISNFPGFHVAV
ncbi:MAG: ABC transporter permease subunit [Eisenbergiella massiliensis]